MINRAIFFYICMICSFAIPAKAEILVPTNMNQADRISALEIIGFGAIGKVLSNPYPMGGYEGLELAVAIESVNIAKLSNLGDTTAEQDDLTYPTFSIGKGLYNNFDLFIHFIPFMERTGISEYGAFFRWGFYTPANIPFSLSLVLHGNAVNVSNRITSVALGSSLVASFHVSGFAIYTGYGFTNLRGQFIGGNASTATTDSGATETETTDGSQWLLGVTYDFDPIFFAIQLDRFNDNTYSAKIGYRF